MQHKEPIPQNADAFSPYVENLYTKLVGAALSPQAVLAASLNIPASDLSILTNMRTMLQAGLALVDQIQQRTKDVNAFWRWFLRGPVDPNAPALQSFPAALAWAQPPLAVPGNAIGWVSKFVTRLKTQPNCTAAVRADLDLDGSAVTPDDPQLWKPILTCSYTAGQPVIGWALKKGARLEILCDYGQGEVLVDIDDRPDFMDTHALPAPGVTALWKYRSVYRLNGARVGQFSDVCEVMVKG